MHRLVTLVLGMVIGGGLIYGAQRYHVVRTNDGFELIPKMSSSLDETYIDVRAFTVTDWANHKMLAAAITAAKKDNIFNEGVATTVHQNVDKLIEGWKQ